MNAKDLGRQPASPYAQTSETHQHFTQQNSGLTKLEHFTGLAMLGLAASGWKPQDIPQAAAELAERQLAVLANGGAP